MNKQPELTDPMIRALRRAGLRLDPAYESLNTWEALKRRGLVVRKRWRHYALTAKGKRVFELLIGKEQGHD